MDEKILTESTSLLTGDNIAVILAACIPAIVTIIGFVVTYFLNKRNFKEEVNKAKVNATLEKISDLPYKILTLMDTMMSKDKSKNHEQANLKSFQELMSLIFAYGSKEAIIIVSSMQETNYLLSREPDKVDKNEIIAYYILLACQVKYDLTGIKINPEYWYRMRLTDYKAKKEKLDEATNKIVDELQLADFLSVKQ
jgi:hypothetical protein